MNLNDFITRIKVFFFNYLADPIQKLSEYLSHPEKTMAGSSGWLENLASRGMATMPGVFGPGYLVGKGIQVYVDVKGKVTPKEIADETAKRVEESEGVRVLCGDALKTYPSNNRG